MKNRGFEKVDQNIDHLLPKRGTNYSAGYDFYLPSEVILPPHQVKLVSTNVKAYMNDDEVLLIYIRSSVAVKMGIQLANGTGIIDADYYPNEIKLALVNTTDQVITLSKDQRIAQGIFSKYLLADNDQTLTARNGGFGSTDEEKK